MEVSILKSAQALERTLKSLDGQKYGAYKRTKGVYEFDQFRLAIDHVQVDPFAPPSKMRCIVARDEAGIPDQLLDDKYKRIAVSDFLTRAVHNKVRELTKKDKKIWEDTNRSLWTRDVRAYLCGD